MVCPSFGLDKGLFGVVMKQLITEDNGNISSMRVINLMIAVTFCASWIANIIRGVVFTPSWEIISLMVGITGVKAIQKKFEKPK